VIRILIDADLILEGLLNRHNFVEDGKKIFNLVHPLVQMYMTDIGMQKIYDYISRLQNTQLAETVINWLQDKIHICSIDQNMLQQARLSPLSDFESAVELVCVSTQELDAIVTHNQENFAAAPDQFCVWSLADLYIRANLETQLQANIFS
jgi:hypothetical protein